MDCVHARNEESVTHRKQDETYSNADVLLFLRLCFVVEVKLHNVVVLPAK